MNMCIDAGWTGMLRGELMMVLQAVTSERLRSGLVTVYRCLAARQADERAVPTGSDRGMREWPLARREEGALDSRPVQRATILSFMPSYW